MPSLRPDFSAWSNTLAASNAQILKGTPDPKAQALIPAGYRFVTPGAFTIATHPGQLPLADYGADSKEVVGVEPDIARLIADGLGLKLVVVPVAEARDEANSRERSALLRTRIRPSESERVSRMSARAANSSDAAEAGGDMLKPRQRKAQQIAALSRRKGVDLVDHYPFEARKQRLGFGIGQ